MALFAPSRSSACVVAPSTVRCGFDRLALAAVIIAMTGTAIPAPTPARAQQAVGVVTGIVRTSEGSTLAAAQVRLEGAGAEVRSDRDGRFAFRGVSRDVATVRVTAPGFRPALARLAWPATDSVHVELVLERLVQTLASQQVDGTTVAALEMKAIRQSPFAVTVLDGQRLAGRGLTLDEALQRSTGVQIRRSGGLGSASVFNVRGLEGQRVQIYINGNAADIAGNRFSLDDIPLQLVERIEVYKGVVPAHFGGDGLGAAVNVVTIHPPHGYLDVGYTAGSYGLQQLSVTAKRPVCGGIEVGASANTDLSENDYMMWSPFTPGLRIRRDHDAYRRSVIGGVVRSHRHWFDELELEAALIKTRREIQGVQTNIQRARARSQVGVVVLDGWKEGLRDGRLDVRIGAALVLGQNGVVDTSSVRYGFDGSTFPSPNGRGELGLLPADSDHRSRLVRQRGALIWHASPAHALNMTWVLDVSTHRPSDSLANAFAGRNVSEYPGAQRSLILGASYEWRPRGEGTLLISGVRGYAFDAEGTEVDLSNPNGTRPPPTRNRTATVGASEAIRHRLTPSVLVKASVELARRLPSTTELFGDGQFLVAAPTLRPERSTNASVGLQFDRSSSGGRRIQWETNAFWMELADMIRLVQGFGGFAANANFGRARVVGADAEIRADLAAWLSLTVNGTWQDARDRLRRSPGTSVANPTFDLRLPNMPWLFGNAVLEAERMGVFGRNSSTRAFAEASFTEEYFFAFELSRRQERRIPRALTLGLGLTHRLHGPGLTMTAEVQNLTDARVLNLFNQPLPGRQFRVKLRYTAVGDSRADARSFP